MPTWPARGASPLRREVWFPADRLRRVATAPCAALCERMRAPARWRGARRPRQAAERSAAQTESARARTHRGAHLRRTYLRDGTVRRWELEVGSWELGVGSWELGVGS